MAQPVPSTMKAVQLQDYTGLSGIQIAQIPTPVPTSGQVLVKMHASPINPSDELFTRGKYGVRKPLPVVPGFEGCGTVVQNGGGFMGWRLLGKRVACFSLPDQNGTYAEYMLASASQCIVLDDDLDFDQAAMFAVNPLTAVAILDVVQSAHQSSFIHTAAASALGRMLVRLGNEKGVKIINVVRRQEQVDLLRSIGAEIVLNSSDPDFAEKLSEECKKLNTRICFDAVGGALAGTIISAMPATSTLYLYGLLETGGVSDIDPMGLVFQRKTVTGFWLSDWISNQGMFKLGRLFLGLNKLLKGPCTSEIAAIYSLDDFPRAVQEYTKQMTRGKILIKPSLL